MSRHINKGQEPVKITLGIESTDRSRFKLDNAATGFSLLACKRIPLVYRLSVSLKCHLLKPLVSANSVASFLDLNAFAVLPQSDLTNHTFIFYHLLFILSLFPFLRVSIRK